MGETWVRRVFFNMTKNPKTPTSLWVWGHWLKNSRCMLPPASHGHRVLIGLELRIFDSKARAPASWTTPCKGVEELIIKGDSVNAIKWITGWKKPCWKWIPVVREIQDFCSSMDVVFYFVSKSTNWFADFLAKMGVDRTDGLVLGFWSLLV